MYKRKVDCETFYERRESIGSTTSVAALGSEVVSSGCNEDGTSSSDHYNPTLRLLQIPRSSSGALGFHLTRSKWDPYPWVSAVDVNTPAKYSGLKAGDCVLEVNEQDVLGMRISDIAKLVKAETIDSVSLLLWSAGCDTKCNPESLCCGPMPSNLERLSACMQTILSIIECPVCLDTIAPPTLQCQNGHILCVKCRILSQHCPVCRQRFHPGRSLIGEQIYNSITDTFNLRNQDKLREKLFGAKYKSSTKDQQQREKQQHNGGSLKPVRSEVNKLHPSLPSHKFLAKLLGKAYSMDNLSTSASRSRPPVSLSSMKNVTNHIGETLGEDDDDDEDDGEPSTNRSHDEQSKPGNTLAPSYIRAPPANIAKQFSLSAYDLSEQDNDGLIAIGNSPSMNRLQYYLRSKRNSLQSPTTQPPPPPAPAPQKSLNPKRTCASLSTSIECVATAIHRNDRLQLNPAVHEVPVPRIRTSCCLKQEADDVFYLCPCNCGNQFTGSTLHKHVKVDHCAPILCYGSSSAELSLPLRAPLDEASVLLMCDGKDFWIKLRTHGEGSITASALLQGPEDESADFMMETRLRNRIGVDQDDNDVVFVVVNKDDDDDDAILERELITRSIVRSMMVTTWDYTTNPASKVAREKEKRSGVLYNRENIRMTFGESIDYRNLLLKIIIKRRGRHQDVVVASGSVIRNH